LGGSRQGTPERRTSASWLAILRPCAQACTFCRSAGGNQGGFCIAAGAQEHRLGGLWGAFLAGPRSQNPERLRHPWAKDIKGAEVTTVRPKSREETPKEGNDAGNQSCRPRLPYLDVRRTKGNEKFLHCRSPIPA